MKIKCGTVGVLGKPNAGKSSLVNALVGEKVSIISPKPQTTRNNILGIYNDNESQIVFVDTPGINKKNTGLDDFMQKSIKGAVEEVDVVLICVDILKGLSETELNLIDNFSLKNIPVFIVFTKIDLVKDIEVFKNLEKYAFLIEKYNNCHIIPVSSFKKRNLKEIISLIKQNIVEVEEENKFFDRDLYTDKPIKFLVAENIREKALYLLEKEIPHGIAVLVENFDESDDNVLIDAMIVCDKDSHKAIILGKNGQMLKQIGHDSRVSIQKILQKKVILNLFVKVKPNWKNNLEFLSSLGYNVNDI